MLEMKVAETMRDDDYSRDTHWRTFIYDTTRTVWVNITLHKVFSYFFLECEEAMRILERKYKRLKVMVLLEYNNFGGWNSDMQTK